MLTIDCKFNRRHGKTRVVDIAIEGSIKSDIFIFFICVSEVTSGRSVIALYTVAVDPPWSQRDSLGRSRVPKTARGCFRRLPRRPSCDLASDAEHPMYGVGHHARP